MDRPRHRVRTVEHRWIPMADGCRLAAKLWIPEDAEVSPVPAILEYIPYRRSDYTAVHDETMHGYFAAHGYACARVDLRGSGDSDGILQDEYLPLEQRDGIEVIAWLAKQAWCSGTVGMIGISWGGFNGLQIASHAPAELGAVISICSTDDRYVDDVHYMGGCLLSATALQWASVMLAYNARPPDPLHVGDSWRAQWLDRMENTPPFAEAWLSHQTRDDYWKQGSVCEGFDDIRCPVYMVGGWTDAYRNAVLRFLHASGGPSKGLIGPWAHTYPEQGIPGPAIGFLQEAVRWWDCHLKGIENGIMSEPRLRVYLPDAVRPDPGRRFWPGRWIALSGWPPGRPSGPGGDDEGGAADGTGLRMVSLVLGADHVLGADAAGEGTLSLRSGEGVSVDPGTWGGLGGPVDNAGDQRPEDGRSLCFDTEPLSADFEILGFPVARLQIESDQPWAIVVVRLCDVWPDGTSHLITRGLLNLTHREGHETPVDLVPGERYGIEVALNSMAYSLPAGHRLRLAVGTSYWPWAWPSPETVTLTVEAGRRCVLELPTWRGRGGGDDPLPVHFLQPEEAPAPAHEATGYEDGGRVIVRDSATGRVEIRSEGEHRLALPATGLEYHSIANNRHRITEGDPLSAFQSYERTITLRRGSWRPRVHTLSTLSCTADEFELTNLVEGFEGEARVFVKTWRRSIPRRGV